MAHRCRWCEANLGKRSYLVTTRLTNSAPLNISTIIDPQNPTIFITEQSATSFKQSTAEYVLRPLNDLLQAQAIPYVPSPLPPIITDTIPHMDLSMDWADAASLGWDGQRYFLLIIDETTKYLATSIPRHANPLFISSWLSLIPQDENPNTLEWTGQKNLCLRTYKNIATTTIQYDIAKW